MANFRTHIGFSSMLGAGYGGAAYLLFDVPLPACALAGGLCSVSGMLPDVDSGPGVPLRESMAFAAAVVPMMMIDRFEQFGMSKELMILAGAVIYLFIRFTLAAMFGRYTVHRGMFHSLPAAVIFGELTFLLSCGTPEMRVFKAAAVVLGYVSHLLLDELYSVEWHRGRLRLKKSFGSALKLIGKHWWPNISTFGKLAVLTLIIVKEPGWMHQYCCEEHLPPSIEQTAERVLDHVKR